jgi:hypothetical protein
VLHTEKQEALVAVINNHIFFTVTSLRSCPLPSDFAAPNSKQFGISSFLDFGFGHLTYSSQKSEMEVMALSVLGLALKGLFLFLLLPQRGHTHGGRKRRI